MVINKKGFTLIELLATIAILGIVITITTISISEVLNSSDNDISNIERKEIEKAVKAYASSNLQKCKNGCIITIDNLKQYMDNLENVKDGFSCIQYIKVNNKSTVKIISNNNNHKCTYIDPNPPKLADGMIPVVYDETNGVWVKADTSSKWYDYNNQMWANAVTVDGCVPKGDINLDGVIDQTDLEIAFGVAANHPDYISNYTKEELLARADIDGSGTITNSDAGAIGRVTVGNNTENLCTNPTKNPATSNTREYYENAEAGTEIAMDDINAMWVWIPRFKYKIASNLGSSTNVSSPPQIDVIFESGTATTGVTEAVYRTEISGTTNTNYYTHPAFRDINNIVYGTAVTSKGAWDEEITGFWMGKFTTGTKTSKCNTSSSITNCKDVDPIIKPDVKSLVYQDISTQFLTSLKFAGGIMDTTTGRVTFEGDNYYGLDKKNDTHVTKNTEWGAVAILSQSQYGKMGNNDYSGTKKEVYLNNSANFYLYTGRSLGEPGKSGIDNYVDYGSYSYDDKACNDKTSSISECTGEKTKNAGRGASTTGTIYGIYDMSGQPTQYTMGNWNKYSGENSTNNSGFNGICNDGTEKIDGISFPESKYYDLYSGSSSTSPTLDKSILGDANWETMRWYNDLYTSVNNGMPWSARGGNTIMSSSSGIFCSNLNYGYKKGAANSDFSFRTTLITQN